MKIIDISWPIAKDMTTYKDRNDVVIKQTKDFEADGVREHTITLGTHTGTHVDAPAHFLKAGETIEKIDIENLVGPCTVLDLTSCNDRITRADLEKKSFEEGDIVLLKTKNSECSYNGPFNSSFVYLDDAAAGFLAEQGVSSVGIDYLGLERNSLEHKAHRVLMSVGIPIIEGLRLKEVQEGEYLLICLPLLLKGLEAAPARALLMKDFQ